MSELYRMTRLGRIPAWYDPVKYEHFRPLAPCVFYDEFFGRSLDTTHLWRTITDAAAAGTPEPGTFSNQTEGRMLLQNLDNTNEVQAVACDFNDGLPFIINQHWAMEFRAKFGNLPAGNSYQVVGLGSLHDPDIDAVDTSVWFRWDGSGAVTVEHDDGVHETSKVATGVTMTLGTIYTFLIDGTTMSDVKFYINGVNVAGGTTFDMSNVPTDAIQPYIAGGKTPGSADVHFLYLDFVRAWQERSA